MAIYSKRESLSTVMSDLSGFFKDGQREAIYNSCKNDRDRMIIRLLWKSGRRVSEVLMIKAKDIDFENDNILWNIEKKKREYRKWKPMDIKTMGMLKEYINSNQIVMESFLFPSTSSTGHLTRIRVYQIVRQLCEGIGIYYVGEKKPHPHHFRHTFAIEKARKLKSPADMRKLQQFLEHSTMGMTENYLQFGDEELRSLVEDED